MRSQEDKEREEEAKKFREICSKTGGGKIFIPIKNDGDGGNSDDDDDENEESKEEVEHDDFMKRVNNKAPLSTKFDNTDFFTGEKRGEKEIITLLLNDNDCNYDGRSSSIFSSFFSVPCLFCLLCVQNSFSFRLFSTYLSL